jgi:hypothetical protein
MAKRSLLSRCPSYIYAEIHRKLDHDNFMITLACPLRVLVCSRWLAGYISAFYHIDPLSTPNMFPRACSLLKGERAGKLGNTNAIKSLNQ